MQDFNLDNIDELLEGENTPKESESKAEEFTFNFANEEKETPKKEVKQEPKKVVNSTPKAQAPGR